MSSIMLGTLTANTSHKVGFVYIDSKIKNGRPVYHMALTELINRMQGGYIVKFSLIHLQVS